MMSVTIVECHDTLLWSFHKVLSIVMRKIVSRRVLSIVMRKIVSRR